MGVVSGAISSGLISVCGCGEWGYVIRLVCGCGECGYAIGYVVDSWYNFADIETIYSQMVILM